MGLGGRKCRKDGYALLHNAWPAAGRLPHDEGDCDAHHARQRLQRVVLAGTDGLFYGVNDAGTVYDLTVGGGLDLGSGEDGATSIEAPADLTDGPSCDDAQRGTLKSRMVARASAFSPKAPLRVTAPSKTMVLTQQVLWEVRAQTAGLLAVE